MIFKTHKIALGPTKVQKTLLSKHCGYARVAYNHCRELLKASLKRGERVSVSEMKRLFNGEKYDEYEWCKELSQNAAKNAIHNLDRAYKNWRNPKLSAKKPRKAKRSRGQSYQADNGKGTVKVSGKSVWLPVIGWVRMRESLRFEGEIATATVTKSYGRWFICLSIKVADPVVRGRGDVRVGIDMGLRTLAVMCDGKNILEVHNPKEKIEKEYKKLRRIDKAIARSKQVHGEKKWSNRRGRLYERRQRLYGRIKHLREDVHHKATSALVKAKSVGRVVVETLNVSGMRRNKKLSRAFHRAGISTFIRMLEYKCLWSGVEFERADRWFASTKTCSECGHKKVAMELKVREYVCLECGFRMDRDANAAKNLWQYGLDGECGEKDGRQDLGPDGASLATSLKGCGGAVRLTDSQVSGAGPEKRPLNSLTFGFV